MHSHTLPPHKSKSFPLPLKSPKLRAHFSLIFLALSRPSKETLHPHPYLIEAKSKKISKLLKKKKEREGFQNFQTLKFLPVKVWPNCQLEGTMFHEVVVRRSLDVTLNDSDWPTKTAFDCQFWPQFRLRLIHSVLLPFTLAFTMSPAPATFVISTKLKYRKPLIVNLIPPCFRHGTL